MADSAYAPGIASAASVRPTTPRHSAIVRLTHWTTTLCFFALLVSGIELIISHPRFYWGEEGNNLTPSLFDIPIPASRGAVKTGYNYVLPDQNGWSRYLHFQTAWLLLFTGLLYGIHGLLSRHFVKNLLPSAGDRSMRALLESIRAHLGSNQLSRQQTESYNLLQRLAYLAVIFILFPGMVWTGLAMSPAFTAGFPWIVDVLGGFQSARTIHFFLTLTLVAFVAVHIAMIFLSGFRIHMRAMITGQPETNEEKS